KRQGATTIGLETMPRTVDNIGFYTRLGFRPGHLTVTLSREVVGGSVPAVLLLSTMGEERSVWIEKCRTLAASIRSGSDYSREIALTAQMGLGDTSLFVLNGVLRGYAVWHGAALAADREPEELRVLKLVADGSDSALSLLTALGGVAAEQQLGRLTLRAESARTEAFGLLVDRGFEVLWTDLRMTLEGYREPVDVGGLVYSNWEI
ncbi:MAG: hypothetical protein SGI84_06240, partial [Gemmatimonadota bacterium]|nr:hypothetical protein [Gemmatimonadota bacterium]